MVGVEKYVHLLGLDVRLVTESHIQERPLHRATPLRFMVPGGGQRNSRGLRPLHRIQFDHEVEVVATCLVPLVGAQQIQFCRLYHVYSRTDTNYFSSSLEETAGFILYTIWILWCGILLSTLNAQRKIRNVIEWYPIGMSASGIDGCKDIR